MQIEADVCIMSCDIGNTEIEFPPWLVNKSRPCSVHCGAVLTAEHA